MHLHVLGSAESSSFVVLKEVACSPSSPPAIAAAPCTRGSRVPCTPFRVLRNCVVMHRQTFPGKKCNAIKMGKACRRSTDVDAK